jgi:hypothetical protein
VDCDAMNEMLRELCELYTQDFDLVFCEIPTLLTFFASDTIFRPSRNSSTS